MLGVGALCLLISGYDVCFIQSSPLVRRQFLFYGMDLTLDWRTLQLVVLVFFSRSPLPRLVQTSIFIFLFRNSVILFALLQILFTLMSLM